MRSSGPSATVQPQSVQPVANGGSYSAMKDAFPNMAEGVVEVNGNVLVTYESGADAYAGTDDDLWANPSMTSTPLPGLGLSGRLVMGPEALGLVAVELEVPARVLTRTSQDTAGVHLSVGDLGRVPQASGFAGAVRRMVVSISDGLRANGKAVDHAADSLRASERDAMRTDDVVHSGFNRARLD